MTYVYDDVYNVLCLLNDDVTYVYEDVTLTYVYDDVYNVLCRLKQTQKHTLKHTLLYFSVLASLWEKSCFIGRERERGRGRERERERECVCEGGRRLLWRQVRKKKRKGKEKKNTMTDWTASGPSRA